MSDSYVSGEMAGTLVAGGGILALFGRGITRVMGWRKSRVGQLEDRVDKLDEHVRASTRQVDCLAGVCVILVDEVQANVPNSRAVKQAKELIGAEFPELYRRVFREFKGPGEMPPGLQSLADRLDDIP